MEHPHEPINAINDWQIWYRNNMKQDGVYKNPDWKSFWEKPYEGNNVYKQTAAQHFSDTIAEFQNEITGAEMFEAFTAAVMQHLEFIEGEYKNIKQLMELVQGHAKS